MIRSRKGNARRSNPLSLKKKQGIIKRNSGVVTIFQKISTMLIHGSYTIKVSNLTVQALARGLNNSRRGRPRPGTKISRNIQTRARSNTLSKAATANLVKKLVQVWFYSWKYNNIDHNTIISISIRYFVCCLLHH